MAAEERKKHILVIEDEKDLADIVIKILKKEGYEVDSANDGEEGLNKIKTDRPDLVLLDIVLPKLDGRDLLKIVKKDKETREIPIVVLSGKAEQWDRNIGLELGAEEYIEKPLEAVKLLRQIRNTLRKRGKTPS